MQFAENSQRRFLGANAPAAFDSTAQHSESPDLRLLRVQDAAGWGSTPDLSMMADAGVLDEIDETFREYERVLDPNYLDQIRTEAKQFSTKRLSRQARLAEETTRRFKDGRNTIRPRSLRKMTRAIHDLQNKNLRN